MTKHSFAERRYIPTSRRWDRKTQTTVAIPAREVAEAIAARMAGPAAHNKSREARAINGAVVVRLMGVKVVETVDAQTKQKA